MKETRIISLDQDDVEVNEALKEFNAEGFELVEVGPTHLILERTDQSRVDK